jgi:hypothetical protein
MWKELLLRFVLGGVAVTVFALIGDLLKPKSFAGLFGAAPSVALGTLGLTLITHGGAYAAIEGRSMIAGAIAFFLYSQVVAWLMFRYKVHALMVGSTAMLIWFITAFGLWWAGLG